LGIMRYHRVHRLHSYLWLDAIRSPPNLQALSLSNSQLRRAGSRWILQTIRGYSFSAMLFRIIRHTEHTFEVEENVGLVVLEHLSHQLRVHVLDVDLLQILVEHHNRLVQFLLQQDQCCVICILI
jgi:hypothetical protein